MTTTTTPSPAESGPGAGARADEARPVRVDLSRLGPLLAALSSLRAALFTAGVFLVVVLAGRAMPYPDPRGPFFRYTMEVAVIVAVGLGALATWWAARRGWSWDADLWPALYGGVAAFSLLGALRGTPFAPNGLGGDQAFRTEAITRFADTWQNVDFTYQGLPSFYAPAYFWVLGRVADLAAIEPWLMTKYGTIAAAMLVPLVCFVLWRRLVPARVAALIAVVPLVVQNYYEPYAWLVIVAFVPWWLETVHGVVRPGVRRWHPVVLGLIGAVLFMAYYYFFLVGAVALVIHVVVQVMRRELDTPQLGRAVLALGVAAIASSVFWLPLGISLLSTQDPVMPSRWFSDTHGLPRLPFLQPTLTGLVSLVGLGFLVLTARTEALSRALAIFLVATYAWYLIGWPAAVLGTPLLTFRSGPFVPLILLIAGVLGLVRIARVLAARAEARPISPGTMSTDHVQALTGIAAVLLLLFAVRTFMVTATADPFMAAARDERLPDGNVTPYAGSLEPDASALPVPVPPDPYVNARSIQRAIDARYAGPTHPVVLSTRADVLALNTYYGFVQWQFFYSHPAADFAGRIEFLRQLAGSTPQEFARLTADNPFDRIDAFVLRVEGDDLLFEYRDDNFPVRTKAGSVTFARSMFDPAGFDVVDLGDYVVAVRR